jgi:two-component system, chemotaxis family, CheB/CheR fusion protein
MDEVQPKASQLVVIGASAGGIEALLTLVATLPPEFPAPIVVAQHLDPSRASHLGAILSRRSTLPVRTVMDHEPLESGAVYVVPADRNVEVTDHEVRLHADATSGPRPSVNMLLGSAARIFGEDLYAVILTGTGSDGADGARLVKEAGGTVIIQNPQTASFPGMPLSLAPTVVDIVADLEAIGPLLQDLLTGAYVTPTPDADRRMRALLEQLRTETGIDFSRYRQPTIQRRLQRRMADTGRNSLDEYVRYLQRHPEEYYRLADSFLIRVTDFFRDGDLFAYLRERLLPELIEEARAHSKELRVWSAGCATGEEAYSLAILLAELLGDEIEDFHLRVFATDINAAAVDFARRGIYPPVALAQVPPELLPRYFTPIDGGYEVKKSVRRFVVFGQHDLAQRSPFPRIDLLLCRNVLIYFTPELQRRVLQLFAFGLRTGARLILGKSETTGSLPEHFVLEDPRLKVYRRQGERMLIAPSQIRESVPLLRPSAALSAAESVRIAPPHVRPLPLTPIARPSGDAPERLLSEVPVGVVVVNRRYHVQAINAVARRLLGIHTPAIGEDFIHLARRADPKPLRAAIDRAFGGQHAVDRVPVKSLDLTPGGLRYLEISCLPQQRESPQEAVSRVVLIVSDVTAAVEDRPAPDVGEARQFEELERQAAALRALAAEPASSAEAAAALAEAGAAFERAQSELNRRAALVADLSSERQELLAANDQLTAANADLRTQNEELLVGNEEAQAALEEIETLNEEQQATNEELETLNEELQATIEELNTANDDLEARGLQLQDTAVALESERSRLAAILTSLADAVLVVDSAGQTMLVNPAFERLFGPGGEGFAPADEQGQPLPPEATPQRRAARGETFEMQFTVAADDGTRRLFEARGRPVSADGQEGSVVIRDVSEHSILRQQSEFLALVGHELRTPLTTIIGNLGLLLRAPAATEEDPRLRRYAKMSLQQARRLTGLVNDLTDVVRLREGRFQVEPEPVDLGALVADLIELAQVQTEGQTLRLDLPAEPIIVSGDPRRLQQVVLNLLTNAITHAPDTEYVDVCVRCLEGEAELQVQDYGPGIPAEDQPNIFSRFFQAASGAGRGLGLGLYITHEIVQAHGGAVEVSSQPGQGAIFTVRIPLAE